MDVVIRCVPIDLHREKTVATADVVRAGEFGEMEVLRLEQASYPPRASQGSWFADEARSGRIIFDLMIHDLEVFLRTPFSWVLGGIASRQSLAVNPLNSQDLQVHEYSIEETRQEISRQTRGEGCQ